MSSMNSHQRAQGPIVRYPAGYFEDELQQEGLEYSAGTRSRTSRAGPRGAGKQARVYAGTEIHDALAVRLVRVPQSYLFQFACHVGVKGKANGIEI